MTETQKIQWKRLSVEAAAIVVSILLAFAIDAWWAENKERSVELEALQALRSDFMESREQLASVIKSLSGAREDFARFQSAPPDELTSMDPNAIRWVVTSIVKNHTFDPNTATLDALVNDGRLGLISDPQLIRRLSNWRKDLDDLDDIDFELRAESVRMRRAMESYGGPFDRWSRAPDNLEVLRKADGEALAAMSRDAEFMGKARSHQYALRVYLSELGKLAETLDSTLAVLDQITAQK